MNRYFTIILITATTLFSACNNGSKHHHEDGDGHHDEHHHGGIVLTKEQARLAGVEVERVTAATFHGVIHTSGQVLSASCDESTVVATISGRVTHCGHVSEGMSVRPGSSLFSITSAGIQVSDGDPIQRARIEFERAERDYQRAQQLVQDKIISQKEFEAAQAEYESARLTYHSLQQHRSATGVIITTPKGGYIKQCLVQEGDYVETGQPLAVITQNQHLYLRAEVPERRFNELSQIQSAKFRTSYSEQLYDITAMGGHVQSYGRSSEVNNSYIPIIFEFNNTGDIVQGSFADIYLISAPRADVITLPLTALTEEQGLHYIYMRVHGDEYRKQEVQLGQSDGERIEILSGLSGGEDVVVHGAMQVKLASATNAIPAHTHNH